jgi:tetratricopeptide (TPR) repeat protein
VHSYREYLLDEDTAGFVKRVAEQYQVATLVRLAQCGGRLTRRAAVLALGMLGDYRINRVLGEALCDKDRGVRLVADQALREIWLRDGNAAQQKKLRIAARLNHLFQFDEAIACADALLAEAPWLAEAHHQRGIARACLGRYEEAILDFHETLELNAYHFPAAAAMGQAHLELNDQPAALECFRRALRLNPDLEGVRARVLQLQRGERS